MRKSRRFAGALLAVAMLVSTVPVVYAADKDGPSAPGLAALAIDPNNTPNGLNGATGNIEDFDYTKYDVVMNIHDIVQEEIAEQHGFSLVEDFVWPDETKILLTVGHDSDKEILDYLDIPEGKIVDVYDFGYWMHEVYICWAHYDTTDGTEISEPETSTPGNTETPGTSENENTGNSGTSTGNYNSSFTDVQPGAWYYDAVMTMADNGIIAGYGNGKFGPDDPLTYQQLWTILDRICNYGNTFASYNGAIWSTEIVTRGGAAYFLAGGKYAAYNNTGHNYYDIVIDNRAAHYIDGTALTTIDEFPDADAIKAWSVEYATKFLNDFPDQMDSVPHMSEMLQKAIINARNYDFFSGVDGAGTFSPYSNLTRAQLCQALYRAGVYDKVG